MTTTTPTTAEQTEALWTVSAFESTTPWSTEQGVATVRIDLDRTDGPRWPAIQPGVHDADGGFRAHRIIADFSLDEEISAVLQLDFSVERGPCPDLELVLDGIHRGIFHPTVEREDRSRTGEPGPIAGPSGVEVAFPRAWLTAGPHTLSVTTVIDEAAAIGEDSPSSHAVSYHPIEQLPAAREHYGAWFGSYLRWSGASLVRVVEDIPPTSISLRPTPLFVSTDDGVRELVDLDICWQAGTDAPTQVTVDWDGTLLTAPSPPSDRQFGMFRWRFVAPSFDGPVAVGIVAGDHVDTVTLVPARKWDLHLIPHVHLDLGFTDAQGKVLELHCRNIDRALDRLEVDPAFRFSVDGSVVVQEYSRTRPAARVARMMAAIESGTLGVNAFHSNFLTGVVGLEELFRSVDYSSTLPRSSRTGIRYANLTDVPTCTSSVPTVLAQRGIEGFVGMSNHGRAATPGSDELHLLSPVRWRGPDGSEVLAHFSDHYSQLRFVAGDPQSVSAGTNGLDRLLSRFDREDYLPTDLAVIGTHADNEDLADGDTGFVERWNARFAYPRFRVSTFDEYLAAVAPLSKRLPVWRGETGSYWEDGVGSAAAEFATYRRTQAILPAAETLGAGVSAGDDLYRTNRTELDRAWGGLSIAAEHTLTWARATSHPHAFPVADQFGWKARFIDDSARVAIDETRRHLAQLAESAGVTGPGYLAYNPHAWAADLEGEVDLADGIDLTGIDGMIDVEVLSSCAGMRRCRISLPGMPAHSYRFLPMSAALDTLPGGESAPRGESSPPGRSSSPDGAIDRPDVVTFASGGHGTPIETPGWIIDLDPETTLPRGLLHKGSGRELLDQNTDLRLGQLIRTAADPFSDDQPNEIRDVAEVHEHERVRIDYLADFGTTTERVPLLSESPDVTFLGVKATFDGIRLRWTGRGAGLESIVIDLLLRDDAESCDLDVRFTKDPCLDMEAIYLAFPFAGRSPVLRYDRQLGWVEPAADHSPGASNEWGAITNTVSLQSTEGEIRWTALDAPLFAAGDVVRGLWLDGFPSDNGHLFSYLMNNFWPCNTPPAQGGDVRFRYHFGIGDAFDPAASARFGRVARVGAQLAEIMPLERYRPEETSEYRAGLVLDLGVHDSTDVQLRQNADDDRMELEVVNLVPDSRVVELRLPPRMGVDTANAGESIATTSDGVSVRLAGFGFARIPLRR